jgi:ParB/RepB/Spo0J family partition protein
MMDLKGLGDLASILDMPSAPTGEPRMFDIDLIDEDSNVRSEDNPGFSEESIGELRASLRNDGMESPISLYPNPDRPGRFIINFGHRRFRAAKAEGWLQVPGFLRPKISRRAQAAENIQRENLTAHEIALYIRDELADGQSQTAIAESMGKSKAWVTQHAKLLDLPGPVAEAVVTGKVTDVTLANELAVAHREHPKAVEDLLKEPEQKPTRAAVKAIRQGTKPKGQPAESKGPMQSEVPADDREESHLVEQGAVLNPVADTTGTRFQREVPDEVKAEFQRRRNMLEREQCDAANPALRRAGMDALNRLIDIARRETGQSKRVADFLLAWWNATSCGGFDLSDLWGVDIEIADDMVEVIGLIRRNRSYPDALNTPVHEAFKELVKIWRPQLVNE